MFTIFFPYINLMDTQFVVAVYTDGNPYDPYKKSLPCLFRFPVFQIVLDNSKIFKVSAALCPILNHGCPRCN